MRAVSFLLALTLAFPCFASEVDLPAFDLEIVAQPSNPSRVGDDLELKAPGAPVGKVSVPKDLQEEIAKRWAIFPNPGEEARFTLVPLQAGKATLPSLLIEDAQGKPIARTHPFELQVASAIDPKDPKPDQPAPARGALTLQFPWVAASMLGTVFLAILALLGTALYRRLRYRRPRAALPPSAPPPPEHEVALAALTTLEKKSWPAMGKFKPHYFGLSEILKAYLGARFDFDAPECTSSELLERVARERWLAPSKLESLRAWFDALDRVKFTDQSPDPGEPERLLEEAREFVSATRRPDPQPPVVEAGAGVGRP